MKNLINLIKKVPIWPFKVILVLYFIWNTEILQSIWQANPSKNTPQVYMTSVERGKREAKLFLFIAKKVKEMKSKVKSGANYTTIDYFNDYADITLFAKKIGIDCRTLGNSFPELQDQSSIFLRKYNKSDSYLEQARAFYYQKIGEPNPDDNHDKITWSIFFGSIVEYFISQASKDLPMIIFMIFWTFCKTFSMQHFEDFVFEKLFPKDIARRFFVDESLVLDGFGSEVLHVPLLFCEVK